MSKYKAAAPIRANTTGSSIRGKISAPIPIPDDEEFPIRSPGTGIATPLGNEGIDKQLRMPTSLSQGIAVTDFTETRAPSTQRSYTEAPLQPRHVLQTTLRNSQISHDPSGAGSSSIEKPQRKKTSLKSVLGRLFGGKKSRNSTPSRSSTQKPSTANTDRADQHRSDPTALNRNIPPEASSQKRSVSLPINEYNRALRSHSPFTETFPLQNPSDTSNRSSTLLERRARTRRATTPSRIFEPAPAAHVENGLAPRPASSHARDSKLFTDDESRSGIGCAVTSGSHPNRRSRSLDGLRQAAHAQAQQTHNRRRSDEIRYWRQSYDIDALSPMSSPKGEKELEDVLPQQELANVGEIPREEEEKAPPQPFNFGPMGAMAGMKITEAANLQTRVSRMEKKMQQMERMMFQMQNTSTAPALTLRDTTREAISARNRRSLSSKRPAVDVSDYSLPRHVDRFRESDQGSSIYSRPSTVETQKSTADTSTTTRPLSTTTTIRGIPSSSPPLPSEKDNNSLTGERYNKLVSFITSEQQARLRLETIVDRLQTQLKEQIQIQSRPTSLPTHHPNAYLQQPRNPESHPTTSHHYQQNRARAQQQSEQSAFEADDSSDSDDEGYPNDVFQTPNEESSPFGGMDDPELRGYGEEDDGDDERDGKRAVRITSLSQLTLGKGKRHLTNF